MFSSKLKSRVLRATLAGAAIWGTAGVAALAAPAVVVKSSASEYPVGSKIDDTAIITLESGDSVTVLTNKGTRTMKGPGTFEVGAKPKSNRARFANLTRKRAASRGTTGAVRGTGDTADRPLSPNLYYVDVEQSGTICLYDLEAVRFWRPFDAGIETYKMAKAVLEPFAGSEVAAEVEKPDPVSIDVTFDDGESLAPLDPALLTVEEGTAYEITSPVGGEPAVISFKTLDADYAQADELAAALVEKGCMAQLELMGEKLGA
ncbi:MAG: hypothetical protein AAFQ90_05225 [Pseudomonadota bacterium]